MSEQDERLAVVTEVTEWILTPYISNGDIKGPNGGVDCGMLLLRVFGNCGLINPIDPRPYPAQWPLHQSTERYVELILQYAKELPEGQIGGPGDIVVFRHKSHRTYHHGGIIAPEWPWIVHAIPPAPVMPLNVDRSVTLSRMNPRFFSIWPRT